MNEMRKKSSIVFCRVVLAPDDLSPFPSSSAKRPMPWQSMEDRCSQLESAVWFLQWWSSMTRVWACKTFDTIHLNFFFFFNTSTLSECICFSFQTNAMNAQVINFLLHSPSTPELWFKKHWCCVHSLFFFLFRLTSLNRRQCLWKY